MSEPIDLIVRSGECPCPGTPHENEHVYLEPELTLAMAAAATAAIQSAEATLPDQQAALIEAYLPRGIRGWTFLEQADPRSHNLTSVPITRENVERLLPWDRGGMDIVEKADELYSGRLMRPLVARMSKLLPPGRTERSIRRSRPSGSVRPEPSRPSSPINGAGKPSAVPVP